MMPDLPASNMAGCKGKECGHLCRIIKYKTSPLKVLEINCGTGEDAVKFAHTGACRFATDASAGMIEKAKEKLASPHMDLPVEFMFALLQNYQALFPMSNLTLYFQTLAD